MSTTDGSAEGGGNAETDGSAETEGSAETGGSAETDGSAVGDTAAIEGLIERTAEVVGAWLGDELLLLDRSRARLHRLNWSAAVVWDELAEGRTLGSLAGAVAAHVGATVPEVQDDVADAVRSMAAAGLVDAGTAEVLDQVDVGTAVATLRAEADALGLDLPEGRLLLHGGAAALDGRAVAFVGASGAGKSTATAALVHAGWAFLGDEVVVVEPDRTVVAHHRPIELTARSVALVGPPSEAVGAGPGAKKRVDTARLAGGRAEVATLVAILLPVHSADVADRASTDAAAGDRPHSDAAGDGDAAAGDRPHSGAAGDVDAAAGDRPHSAAAGELVGARRLGAVEAVEALAASSFNAVDLDDGLEQLVALVTEVPVFEVRTAPLDDLSATVAAIIAP